MPVANSATYALTWPSSFMYLATSKSNTRRAWRKTKFAPWCEDIAFTVKALCVRQNGDRGQRDAHELHSLGLRERVLDLRGSEQIVLQQLLLLRGQMRKLEVGTGRIRDDAEHNAGIDGPPQRAHVERALDHPLTHPLLVAHGRHLLVVGAPCFRILAQRGFLAFGGRHGNRRRPRVWRALGQEQPFLVVVFVALPVVARCAVIRRALLAAATTAAAAATATTAAAAGASACVIPAAATVRKVLRLSPSAMLRVKRLYGYANGHPRSSAVVRPALKRYCLPLCGFRHRRSVREIQLPTTTGVSAAKR